MMSGISPTLQRPDGIRLRGAAAAAGHQVTLVTGPVDLPISGRWSVVRVISAIEMLPPARLFPRGGP